MSPSLPPFRSMCLKKKSSLTSKRFFKKGDTFILEYTPQVSIVVDVLW